MDGNAQKETCRAPAPGPDGFVPARPRVCLLYTSENDEVLRTVDKLLTGAVSMDIYEVKAACEALGGVSCLLYTSWCGEWCAYLILT